MKEKFSQLFKDKLFLVMFVLGLLTMVAAAGVLTIQRENSPQEHPYMQMQEPGAMAAEERETESPIQIAGDSNAKREEIVITPAQTQAQEEEERPREEPVLQAGSGQEAAVPLVLDFSEAGKLAWPVMGNILLDYSMDTTIYFPTLDQYQCSPGVVIQAEVSQPVAAPANARVTAVGFDEEIGNFVELDLGNDYTAVCGQLKEVQVTENEYLEKGQLLGYVAEPTKYYSVEGSNVFFELRHSEEAVDPVGYFE